MINIFVTKNRITYLIKYSLLIKNTYNVSIKLANYWDFLVKLKNIWYRLGNFYYLNIISIKEVIKYISKISIDKIYSKKKIVTNKLILIYTKFFIIYIAIVVK